ncbi:MAG: endonuclease/exonuclease/phosphatase family protein [Oscillospiraceae bacterium]|nr:endonuclease/exonuclease/phosphatase family protein [Oscillospiraceae bacterium]
MTKIRVMSFNIRNACDKGAEAWESRIVNFVPLVKNASPDLIGFQEVLHSQYIDLTECFPEYASAGVGRDDGVHAGEYAAIFYRKNRFSLLETNSFWLSEMPDRPSLGWDAACIRICTYVILLDNETQKKFIHYNTHLDHVGQTAMLEGAKLIRNNMLKTEIPSFLTGDFNVKEKSAPYNIMTEAGVSDAKYTAKSSMSHGTFHGYRPSSTIEKDSPIDYLFYTSNDFYIESYKVLINGFEGAYTSDHYPIVVTLSQC